jgi:hypothetical protein
MYDCDICEASRGHVYALRHMCYTITEETDKTVARSKAREQLVTAAESFGAWPVGAIRSI